MLNSNKNVYCINFDWLQFWTIEPDWVECPEDYEKLGYKVVRRDYGTRVFRQKFTLFEKSGLPFLEIARQPVSSVIQPKGNQVRVVNARCYDKNIIRQVIDFFQDLGFHYREGQLASITRLDLAIDFRVLTDGTKPADFLRNYMAGKLTKVRLSNVHSHGIDTVTGKQFNSVSWGSPSSMVSVKMYNKTLEMAQVKEKSYIRQAWVDSHVLTDSLDCSEVWRVEFSMSSECKEWVLADNGEVIIRHNLQTWSSPNNVYSAMKGLLEKYFDFRKVIPNKRKYDLESYFPIRLPSNGQCYTPRAIEKFRDTGRGEIIMLKRLDKLIWMLRGSVIDVEMVGHVRKLVADIYQCKSTGTPLYKVISDDKYQLLNELMSDALAYIESNPSFSLEERLSAETCRGIVEQCGRQILDKWLIGQYAETLERYSSTAVQLRDYFRKSDTVRAELQALVELEKYDVWDYPEKHREAQIIRTRLFDEMRRAQKMYEADLILEDLRIG